MNFDFPRVFDQLTPLLWEGLRVTVYVSVVSIILGMIVGLISCFMVISRPRRARWPMRGLLYVLKWSAGIYVWIIRGTPMLVQAMFFFFGVNQVLRTISPALLLSPVTAGIITVTLNAGAYFTEIFRAGIESVDKGQSEAARSLGLSQAKTMRKIILPQALRMSLPPMVNQWIISVKDTSLLSAIGVAELMQQTRIYAMGVFVFFESFIYVALWYLAILSLLMVLSKRLEARISYDKKN